LAPVLDGKGGLRFNHTVDELETLSESFLKSQQKIVDDIAGMPKEKTRTFKNTVIPFENMESDHGIFSNVMSFYSSVASSKEMREASEKIEKKFDDFENDLYNNIGMYNAMKEVKNHAILTGSWEELGAEDKKLHEKILLQYKRSGIELD
jgi:Zn-dependent oligopeptidase